MLIQIGKAMANNFGLQKQYLKKENNNAMLTSGICIMQRRNKR